MSFKNANLPLTKSDVVLLDAYCEHMRVTQEELYQFGCDKTLPAEVLQLVEDMESTLASTHCNARNSELAHEGWVHNAVVQVVNRSSMMLSMLKAMKSSQGETA